MWVNAAFNNNFLSNELAEAILLAELFPQLIFCWKWSFGGNMISNFRFGSTIKIVQKNEVYNKLIVEEFLFYIMYLHKFK